MGVKGKDTLPNNLVAMRVLIVRGDGYKLREVRAVKNQPLIPNWVEPTLCLQVTQHWTAGRVAARP